MFIGKFKILFLIFPVSIAVSLLFGCQTIEIQQHISELQSVYDQDDAIHALVAIGQPAVDPLIASLDSENDNIRSGAEDALDALGVPSLAQLVAILKNRFGDVRCWAVGKLKDLSDVQAVEPLIACLRDNEPIVRAYTAQALGALKDARAVEPLLARLTDPSSQAHYGIVTALRSLKDVPKTDGDQVSLLIALSAWDDLAALGKDTKAMEPIIARLSDDDVVVRSHIAEVLGRLGDARTVEPLIACLKDEHGSVRSSAAKALGTLKDGRAIAPLVVCLKDDEAGVRSDVAGALKTLGYAPKIERDKFDFLIAAQSWDDLANLGKPKDPSVVDSLVALLSDQNAGIRSGAAFVLGKHTSCKKA